MELPEFPSYDFMNFINHQRDSILTESTTTLTNMRDYLERNVSCDLIGGDFQDIIESLTPENMLRVSKCVVKSDRLIKMMQELLNYANNEKMNRMNYLLFMDYVLELASSQGIIFPFILQSTINDPMTDRSSFDNGDISNSDFFNAQGTNEEKTQCEYLWNTFSIKMTELAKKYLIEMKNPENADEHEEFGKLLEVLTLFNSTTNAWKMFKECRQLSFDTLVKPIITKFLKLNQLTKTKNQSQVTNTIEDVLNNWELFTKITVKSLKVDCRFIATLFGAVSNAQEAILNFYLDFTAEQVKIILDNLQKLVNINSSQLTTNSKSNVKISVISDKGKNGNDISQNFTHIETVGSSDDLKVHVSNLLTNYSNYEGISRLLASFSRMEHCIDAVLNSQWSTTVGVNIDVTTVATAGGTKKPKGVLKIRRSSRKLSTDIGDYRMTSISDNHTTIIPPVPQPSHTAPSPVFEEDPTNFVPCIEWHQLAEPLFPLLSLAMQYHLKLRFEKIELCKQPKTFFLTSHSQPTPNRVSQSVQEYLQFLEECVATVLACSDSPPASGLCTGSSTHPHPHPQQSQQKFDSISNDTPHAIAIAFQNTLRKQIPEIQEKMKKKTSSQLSLSVSVLLLADCAAFQMTWSLLNNIFKPKSEEIGVYFFDQRKLFSDFHKDFIRQISDRCYNELVSVVLQDSKSNFWADMKEFHENSRVGYPIQAWHLYLERLWTLVSNTCAGSVAREVLSDVLIRSLEFLVQRYASAKPSRRRLAQVRADMIAILHIVEYFIYKISENVDDLFGFGEELSKLKRIHFACMSLLQVLLVLTAPLQLLSSFFGGGFKRAVSKLKQSYSNCFWLNIIKPHKYQCFLSNEDGMKNLSSEESGLVSLELLLQTQQFDGSRVIEIICHEKMSLVSKILIRLCQQLKETENYTKFDKDYKDVLDIFVRFYRIMIRIAEPFSHFHTVLIDVINSCDGWSVFLSEDRTRQPVWLEALYELLSPYLNDTVRLIKQWIIQNCSGSTDSTRFIDPNVLNATLFPDRRLPCGCELSECRLDTFSLTGKNDSIIEMCPRNSLIKEVSEKLVGESLRLPVAIQLGMSRIQEQLEQKGTSVLGGHVVIDSLLESMKRKLMSSTTSDGNKFNDHVETLWMEIVKYIEDNDTFQNTKDLVIQIYGKKIYDADINSFQGIDENRSAKTFFLGMQYSQITACDDGLEDMKLLDGFIRQNGDTLRYLFQINGQNNTDDIERTMANVSLSDLKLDWTSLIGYKNDEDSNKHNKSRSSTSSTDTITPASHTYNMNNTFRPIEAFCKIGSEEFDHNHYYKISINWEKLCSTDIGLSEICLETLLYNRWELEWAQKEEDGGLTDEDKEAALMLLKEYELGGESNAEENKS